MLRVVYNFTNYHCKYKHKYWVYVQVYPDADRTIHITTNFKYAFTYNINNKKIGHETKQYFQLYIKSTKKLNFVAFGKY